jgi:cell division protein DivIC
MNLMRTYFANRYLLATVFFVVLLLFTDRGNVFDQYKLYKQYRKVKEEHAYYQDQIKKAKQDYEELFSNQKKLEKFARENYLMKRDDEDVFVIEYK